MDIAFDPVEYGYDRKGYRAIPYGDAGWVIVHPSLPTIAIERGTGWYCLTPEFYNQAWMPEARAMFA